MTDNEALKITETIDLSKLEISGNTKYIAKWGRAVETLREKQIPKKPIRNNPIINEIWVKEAMLCPVCHAYVNRFNNYHCDKCGQKIDWSDEE